MSFWNSGLPGSPLDGFAFLAYLDPGTGSYALQMILASLFGGMFALKQSWAGMKAWFLARSESRRGIGVHPTNVERRSVHGRTSAKR